MFDVYIAHKMTGRKIKDVLQEASLAHEALKAAGLTYYEPSMDEGLEHKDPESVITTAFDPERMKWYVSKDLNAIANSRVVLNLTGDMISDGCTWEMAFMVYQMKRPVVIVAPGRKACHIVGFTNILVDHIAETLEEAICHISKLVSEQV